MASAADGDARRALNLLELAADLTEDAVSARRRHGLLGKQARFDNQGEYFYDQISALHKAIRGTDPDASLYWFARMLDGGCDPLYIARRLICVASEDIGNADRVLAITLDAWAVMSGSVARRANWRSVRRLCISPAHRKVLFTRRSSLP